MHDNPTPAEPPIASADTAPAAQAPAGSEARAMPISPPEPSALAAPSEAAAQAVKAEEVAPSEQAEPAVQPMQDERAEEAIRAAPTAPVAQPAAPDLSPAACAAQLAILFPAVFAPGAPKPLKLRVQVDIQQRTPGTFTKKALSHFLQRHTTGTAYLKALVNAPHRLDLDGAPAGEPTDEHRQAAVAELERRRALHDARRAAERDAQRNEQRDAQRKAQDEARRAYEADAGARAQRVTLLRAFDMTTLTRKNFCALKGVPEAELDAQLERARQERAQAPRPERQPERRPEARPHTRADALRDGRGPRPERGATPHHRSPPAGKPQR